MVTQASDRLAAAVAAGERRAIAEALNLLEDRRPAARSAASQLLEALPRERLERGGQLVGITGPPGVGKSSMVAALIDRWRGADARVGVLAVDPSSPLSGGALLGDRLRMLRGGPDANVFIRSLAGRGELGGLSADVFPMSQVMLCAFDVVLVETIGVGQSEVDVMLLTDTSCLVVQPSSGDMIQFLKAGIVELPSIFAVNKADLGLPARRALQDLEGTLGQRGAGSWQPPVVLTSALTGEGIDELAAAIEEHRASLAEGGRLRERRREQAVNWGLRRLRDEFGRFGVEGLGDVEQLQKRWLAAPSIFAALEETRVEVLAGWRA